MENESSSKKEAHYTYMEDIFMREQREAEERVKRRLYVDNERKPQCESEERYTEREKQDEEARRRQQYMRQLLRKRAEVELKMIEEQKLCRRRNQLSNYTFGNKTGLDNFRGLQIEDVTQLRLGLIGPRASGKSMFINTCERTLRQTEKGTVPEITPGQVGGTLTLQDYLPEMFFRLVDTRGFFQFNAIEAADFENILTGKIQPGDEIFRYRDDHVSAVQETYQKPELSQRLHGIIFVVKANDPRLLEGALADYLEPVRDVLRETGKV